MTPPPPKPPSLLDIGRRTIQELEISNGIMASGREEIYGCVFGRDSLITALKLLKAYGRKQDPYLLELVKKILVHLGDLQGKEVNIESGEEPGKCIHEFRTERHEHLTGRAEKPWYLYPDNTMRNFDSVDATPLFLITIHRYYQESHDREFLLKMEENIERALHWILKYGDTNGDKFIDYRVHPDRKHGGLVAQNWMDSVETLFHEDTEDPTVYPIAPIEVQAYTYMALRLWGQEWHSVNRRLANRLTVRARHMKAKFNEKFILQAGDEFHLAAAIDGNGKPLASVRSSMGHVLWASFYPYHGKRADSILEKQYVPKVVERLLAPDIFEPTAGIRTLSKQSKKFQAQSYHNGSIWPHDNSLIIEGLENFGYLKEAARIRRALMQAFEHFQTPIELFVFDDTYADYLSAHGQKGNKKQAWSAAALLNEALAIEAEALLSKENT